MAVPAVIRATRGLATEPMPGLPGFRRMKGAARTLSDPAFAGLDAPDPELTREVEAIRADPAAAFPAFDAGGGAGPKLVIRAYSDYACGPCRALDAWLTDWDIETPGVTMLFRAVAMLGPASERMARAGWAGHVAGAPLPVRKALWQRGLRPGPEGVRQLAEAAGVAPGDLARAHADPRVDRLMLQARAEAAALGVAGTPALLVGHTLVLGSIDARILGRLVSEEADRLAA